MSATQGGDDSVLQALGLEQEAAMAQRRSLAPLPCPLPVLALPCPAVLQWQCHVQVQPGTAWSSAPLTCMLQHSWRSSAVMCTPVGWAML